MGFFSEIANEARRGVVGSQAQTAIRQTVVTTPPSPVAPEPAPVPPVAVPAVQPEPAPEAAVPAPPVPAQETAATPAEAKQEPMLAPETAPPPELKLDAAPALDDDAKRKAHEAAEAKRKAEFDAEQAEKKAARQAALDRIKRMNDAALLEAVMARVATETERLTRRNMKDAVAEHVQARSREDIAFAMQVMDPEKSMANCFRYINRKAREYAEQEMKDQGIERQGVYGLDVPDGLCYQWAEDYFNDENAEEDHKDDEKFVPKPYVSAARKKAQGKTSKKSAPAAKPKAENPSESSGMEQISLM